MCVFRMKDGDGDYASGGAPLIVVVEVNEEVMNPKIGT